LRPTIDRHTVSAGFTSTRLHRLSQRHAEPGIESLKGRRGIGSVDKQLHLRRVTCIKVAGKVRRDVQCGVGAAFPHFALQLIEALHFANYAKGLCVNEAIDQLTALNRPIFIQNKHCHVFDVVIQRIAECDHFDQRRKEKEEERQRIARDNDELFKENCAKPAKQFVFHDHQWVIPSEARDLAYAEKALAINLPTSDSSSPPTHFSYCAATLLFPFPVQLRLEDH